MRARYREILESRIGRVMRLASSEADSSASLLSKDEADLYQNTHRIVSEWRDAMREVGEE
jgi:DNA replication initiation complex subunit (GINS family)